jgi:hypothetical protein
MQVFRGKPEGRSYTELAIVTVHSRWWWSPSSWDDLLRDMCREAARAGANAIIDVTVGDLPYSWMVGPVSLGGNIRYLKGVAVLRDPVVRQPGGDGQSLEPN